MPHCGIAITLQSRPSVTKCPIISPKIWSIFEAKHGSNSDVKVQQLGLLDADFMGHSFWKDAAQNAVDHGMLGEAIQQIGR